MGLSAYDDGHSTVEPENIKGLTTVMNQSPSDEEWPEHLIEASLARQTNLTCANFAPECVSQPSLTP